VTIIARRFRDFLPEPQGLARDVPCRAAAAILLPPHAWHVFLMLLSTDVEILRVRPHCVCHPWWASPCTRGQGSSVLWHVLTEHPPSPLSPLSRAIASPAVSSQPQPSFPSFRNRACETSWTRAGEQVEPCVREQSRSWVCREVCLRSISGCLVEDREHAVSRRLDVTWREQT